MDPPTIEIRSLAVLADKQVTTHISEEDVLKLAPLHVNLIHGTRMKRKNNKGNGEWSQTAAQPKKEEGQKKEQDLLENSGGIKPGNINKTGDKSIKKDQK